MLIVFTSQIHVNPILQYVRLVTESPWSDIQDACFNGITGHEEPTRDLWRSAIDFLIAETASKYRVQEAKATGIGRSISWMSAQPISLGKYCYTKSSHQENILWLI